MPGAMVDFRAEVLERSRRVPVVVDFWAEWCGPCRVLGPILEELASEAAGRWELVKIDTERQPELARDYDVRGIPAVKMFHDGEVVAEFVGAQAPDQVRRWLDASLPDPRIARLNQIDSVAELERFVEDHPDLPDAQLRLAQAIVTDDPARARRLAREAMAEGGSVEQAAGVSALADLMERTGDLPEKIAPHVEGARIALAAGDLDRALTHLVDLAMRDRMFGDELARRAALALFARLGPDHELTREHRRRLAMALHS